MPGTYFAIGAGKGISVATAARFGREGYDIILAARSQKHLEELAAALAFEGVDVRVRSSTLWTLMLSTP